MTLASLQRHIAQSIRRIEAHPPVLGKAKAMADAVARMQEQGGTGSEIVARNRIHEALDAFGRLGAAGARSYLRYMCWGLTEPAPPGPLLRHPDFPEFLDMVRRAIEAGQLGLSPWRGLLQGYFGATTDDLDAVGIGHWRALRTLLAETLPAIKNRVRAAPAWLACLSGHATLLGDRPGDRYAKALLDGRTDVIDPLRRELGLPPSSWFWHELALAQVRAACTMDDTGFLAVLDHVLAMLTGAALRDNHAIRNDSLVELLPRYHRTLADTPHPGLRDFAIMTWGNPDIFAQSQWAQVPAEVGAMVRNWLAREALQTIFEVLQADGTVDSRRFTFWLRYHRQMSFVRIALGGQAWTNPHPDFQALKKKPHVCRLDGGQGNASAIIMKLGPYYFVEFSHTGNAAYGYAEERTGFALDHRVIERGPLSDQGRAVFRETHMDRKDQGWERKFEKRMADMGVFPDPVDKTPAQPVRSAAAPARPLAAGSARTPLPFDMARFEAYCEWKSLKFVDYRPRGGALWVSHFIENDQVSAELSEMGFVFMSGRGFWRK